MLKHGKLNDYINPDCVNSMDYMVLFLLMLTFQLPNCLNDLKLSNVN